MKNKTTRMNINKLSSQREIPRVVCIGFFPSSINLLLFSKDLPLLTFSSSELLLLLVLLSLSVSLELLEALKVIIKKDKNANDMILRGILSELKTTKKYSLKGQFQNCQGCNTVPFIQFHIFSHIGG